MGAWLCHGDMVVSQDTWLCHRGHGCVMGNVAVSQATAYCPLSLCSGTAEGENAPNLGLCFSRMCLSIFPALQNSLRQSRR